MKPLWINFKTTFNDNGWSQTDAQKQVLASVEHLLTHEKNPHAQCQALLNILYQAQHEQVADADHIHQLMLTVLTTWLVQQKPDRLNVQAVIRDLLEHGLGKGKSSDPKQIQILKDLIIIGAQIAYYREDEKKAEIDVKEKAANENELEKELLERRTLSLQQFIADMSSTITQNPIAQRATKDVFANLKNALAEINLSKNSEALVKLSVQGLFEQFFSSTYDAKEFASYQRVIQKWIANKASKDSADEMLLLHFLQRGVEQVSKERESAGFGRGYKLFSMPAQQFSEFLTQMHQQHGIPNLLKLQALREDIAIGQAKLLDSISEENEVFSLAEKLLVIAKRCEVPPERQVAFYHRLWEVGVEKSAFFTAGLTRGDFANYRFWGTPGYWHKGAMLYHPGKFDEDGIPKDFWNGFLRQFIQSYQAKALKPLIANKDYLAFWTLCNAFNPLTRVSQTHTYFRLNIAFLSGIREVLFQTIKDCQASFQSVDDVISYLQAEITVKTGVLSNQWDWDCVGNDEKDDQKFGWGSANDRRSNRLLQLTWDKAQLSQWLKVPADYKKLLKTLVVDLLAVKKPLYTDYVVKQVKVLMEMNPDITQTTLHELKSDYPKQLEKNWGMLEARVLAPQRSLLLSTLLTITCLNDMEHRYTDKGRLSDNPLDQENQYHQFFTQLFAALGDDAAGVEELKLDSTSSQTIHAVSIDAFIPLLHVAYAKLAASKAGKHSLEKKFVASLSLLFMLLEKPSSEQYQKWILAFYALKQTDDDFVIDLLILRAQSLQTLEELKAFAELLKALQQKYLFPEGGVEQALAKAVESEIALRENPDRLPSPTDPRLADFKAQQLVSYFSSTESCQGVLKALSMLKSAYRLSMDDVDKNLLKQLLCKAIEKDANEPEWKAVDLKRVLALCHVFEDDERLVQLTFSLLAETNLANQLNELPQGTFERQFVGYVVDKQAKAMGEKIAKLSPQQFEGIIQNTYALLKKHTLVDNMPSGFLQAYFAACFQGPNDLLDPPFLRVCSFAEFVLYKMPYEDKTAPDLLKQLTENLSLIGYKKLIEALKDYATRHHQPMDKLEDFLFTTLEIAARKATTQAERTELLAFVKGLNEKLSFSSSDKQLLFVQLMHKITLNQFQENRLAIERMGKELEALEVTEAMRGMVKRFEGYEDEKQKNNAIYLAYKAKLADYQKSLNEAKTNCHQRMQLIRDDNSLDQTIDGPILNDWVTKSEEAKTEIEKSLKIVTEQYKLLTQEINKNSLETEAFITARYTTTSQKFNQFLLDKLYGKKDEQEKTEPEKRIELEAQRKTSHNLITTIQHRDPAKSAELTQQIDQAFASLDKALQQKATILDAHQQTIEALAKEIERLKTQPNVMFKIVSDKVAELDRLLEVAEKDLQKQLPEFQIATTTLDQAQAFANEVKQQEAKQQKDFETLQKEMEKLLSDLDMKLHPQADRLKAYQQQRAKFELAGLKGLDNTSRADFIATEQRLVTVFTALETPMADWTTQYQAQQQTFQTARQKLSNALADPKLSLTERETAVKQFEFEKQQLDRLTKGFEPQLTETEKRFDEVQAELVEQQQRILTAFDQQIDKRVKQVEALHADIGKLSDEEIQLRASIQGTDENDTWFKQVLLPYRDTLSIQLFPEEGNVNEMLSDVTRRQAGLQHILQQTDEARAVIEKRAALELKALQRLTKTLLPRVQDYRMRLQKITENNRMAWRFANAALTVLDHGVLSSLPFVASLRTFSQAQDVLVRYQQPLMNLEMQCEALMTLQQPLSVEAHFKMITIQAQLQQHLTQLQTHISNPFFASLIGALMEDEVEQAKSAFLDTETKILKSEQSPHWLLSEAKALTMNANTLMARLFDLQTHATQYHAEGETLLKGIEEEKRLKELNTAIETVRTSTIQTEETVKTVQTELNTLLTTKQQFVDDVAEEHYQRCLNAYHAKANSGLLPLALLLNDSELSGEQKHRLFNALVQRYPHSVNQQDEHQQTPLHLAVLQGDTTFVEALLKAGAHSNVKDATGKTPLDMALLAQQTAIIRSLTRFGATSDGRVATAVLQQCIANHDMAYAEFLLKRKNALKINVNHRDKKGNTALHQAVEQKNLALVKLLLTHGARTDSKNRQGEKALNQARKNALLHLSAKAGDGVLFDLLLQLGADIESRDEQNHTLLLTVYAGLVSANDEHQQSAFKQLFNQVVEQVKFDPEDRLNDGNTLLHLAAKVGDVETVERFAVSTGVLLDTCHTDLQNAAKETPLHLAVKGGHGKVVQLLFQKGANPDMQDKTGETALSLAAKQNQINLVKWLFLKGARLDSQNTAGETAFNTPEGRMVFKQLVPSTTQLNVADKKRLMKQGGGDALLHLAVEEGNTELLQWLVEAQGVDLNTRDGEGTTLLGLLSQPQFFNMLSQDCDPKDAERLLGIKRTNEDIAVQSLTTPSKRQVYLEYLIEKGATFWEVQDKTGNHLLHLLVAQGLDNELVKKLVNRLNIFKRSAVLNTLNSEGETLLHRALQQGHIELVALLVEKGARLDIVNRDGEKPFDTKAGMAMYLTLKGQVIDDQTLPWLIRLRKWMEGRDYRWLVNRIEAEQQAKKAAIENEPPSLFDDKTQEDEQMLFQDKRVETNPFAEQEKSPSEKFSTNADNKTSWFDEMAHEMKETSLFEAPVVPTHPFESISNHPFDSVPIAKGAEETKAKLSSPSSSPMRKGTPLSSNSQPVYPSVFVEQKPAKPAVGDDFDRALQSGNYESAKQLLQKNRGYQRNRSFQTLPRTIKRYLLLDSKALPVDHALAHAKKSLRLEEAYVEKHDALYDAVVNRDSTFVAEWFNVQAARIKHIEDRVKQGDPGATAALALCHSQLFEVINLQRDGVTLFGLLIEREKARQLSASDENEAEDTEQAFKRHEDSKILRILMAYVPTSALSPTVAKGLALYDLVDTSALKPADQKATSTADNVDNIDYDEFEASALTETTLPIDAESAQTLASKQLPSWLRDAQKLFIEITGFISETLTDTKEKVIKAQQQAVEKMAETVVAPKDLIEVYRRYQPATPTQGLTTESYDLSVMATEKPPVREELDQLLNEEKNPEQQTLPMLIRHQNHIYFYGRTPGGMTLLEPLHYETHAALYDGILPKQGYDVVMMPKPIVAVGMGEPQPLDMFDEQELSTNEFRLCWDKKTATLRYRVKDIEGRERSGFISTEERAELWNQYQSHHSQSHYVDFLDALEEVSKSPQKAAELLKPYFPQLLQITHKRKHTHAIKSLLKAQIPAELYQAIGNLKGHMHGMLPADQRPKQGQALAETMSGWINDEMGKNFKGADIVDVRDAQGNTLLHLAVRDNLDVLVEWLLPSSLTQDVKHWVEKTFAEAKGKLFTAGASEASGLLGNIAAAAVGTIVTGATLPVLGPLSIAAGVLAGKLTSLFAEGASGLAAEKIYDAAKAQILLSLEQRIDVHHQNHEGDTALHIAARTAVENNLWIVSALLAKAKPEDLRLLNKAGESALHLAVKHRNAHIVALLLLAGANPNLPNAEGKTALHVAAIQGDETLFQMLLESGANRYAKTQLGQTAEQLLTQKISLLKEPLHKATHTPKMLTQLIDEKARYERMLNLLSNDKSFIQKAKQLKDKNDSQQAEQQKEAWWDNAEKTTRQRTQKPIEADAQGNTLLHVLVQNKANYALVEDLLLHYDVKNLNQPNHQGNTPLHLAVLHQGNTGTNAKIIQLLLAHGANPHATNQEDKTPIELVPNPNYQYKIDALFHASYPQKKDSAETEFFSKAQTSTASVSTQKPLNTSNKVGKY